MRSESGCPIPPAAPSTATLKPSLPAVAYPRDPTAWTACLARPNSADDMSSKSLCTRQTAKHSFPRSRKRTACQTCLNVRVDDAEAARDECSLSHSRAIGGRTSPLVCSMDPLTPSDAPLAVIQPEQAIVLHLHTLRHHECFRLQRWGLLSISLARFDHGMVSWHGQTSEPSAFHEQRSLTRTCAQMHRVVLSLQLPNCRQSQDQ
jgi:hypothetical protein